MSLSHKAFVFDWDEFQTGLARTLDAALRNGDVGPLRDIITRDREALTDPYKGMPLPPQWEAMIETHDAHQYGDFALTRYYDPGADEGLGSDWEVAARALTAGGLGESVILGEPFGPSNAPFDPGKMGAYFQSPMRVRANLDLLEDLLRRRPELSRALEPTRAILQAAVTAGRGLYITF